MYLLEYKLESIQEDSDEMEKAYKYDVRLFSVSFGLNFIIFIAEFKRNLYQKMFN